MRRKTDEKIASGIGVRTTLKISSKREVKLEGFAFVKNRRKRVVMNEVKRPIAGSSLQK